MANKKSLTKQQSAQRIQSRADLEPLARLLCATNLLGLGNPSDVNYYGGDSPAPVLAVRVTDSQTTCLPMFWVGDGQQSLRARSVAAFLGDRHEPLPNEYLRIVKLAYESIDKLGSHAVEAALDKAGVQLVCKNIWGAEHKAITQDMCRQWMSVGIVDTASLCRLAQEAKEMEWQLDAQELAWVEACEIAKASATGSIGQHPGSLRV